MWAQRVFDEEEVKNGRGTYSWSNGNCYEGSPFPLLYSGLVCCCCCYPHVPRMTHANPLIITTTTITVIISVA